MNNLIKMAVADQGAIQFPAGRTSHWTFDNISGTSPNVVVNDEDGNHNLNSYLTGLSTPPGWINNGGVLASSNASLYIPSSGSLLSGDTELTLTGIFKIDNLPTASDMVAGAKVNTFLCGYDVSGISNPNQFFASFFGGGNWRNVHSSWTPDTNPHFFAIRIQDHGDNTTTVKVTVDGITNSLIHGFSWSINIVYDFGLLCDPFMTPSSPAFPWNNGWCDEIMWWKNKCLTDGEVAIVKSILGA